ncbi:hypothetical protein ACFVWY_11140 [Streptomyces sp. NPDC058195]|uniref:hypothetical protein n=1 Tax=Streptomyces sp. NPDC058195 TaxID=3346375 RepID=UPI0036F11AE9
MGTEHRPSATYHVYRGPDRAHALEFLRGTPVMEPHVYVIVETPQGNLGRDLIYVFEESDGRPVEFGARTRLENPASSDTHCAWCGFYVVPFAVPREAAAASTLSVYLTMDEAREKGHGLRCHHCALLQCVFCADFAASGDGGTEPHCRACGRMLKELVKVRGS